MNLNIHSRLNFSAAEPLLLLFAGIYPAPEPPHQPSPGKEEHNVYPHRDTCCNALVFEHFVKVRNIRVVIRSRPKVMFIAEPKPVLHYPQHAKQDSGHHNDGHCPDNDLVLCIRHYSWSEITYVSATCVRFIVVLAGAGASTTFGSAFLPL